MSNEVKIVVSAESTQATAGLSKAAKAVDNFKKETESKLSGLSGKLGTVFAALGGGAAVKSMLDDYGAIADTAAKLGESTDSIQKVAYAAEQGGTNLDTISKAMVKVNSTAIQAVGGNEELRAAFASLGLDAATFLDLPMEEKLAALAAGWEQGGSDAAKLDSVMKVLGKSGADLIPLLGQGAAELQKAFNDASVVSADMVSRLDATGDKLAAALAKVKSGFAQLISWGVYGVEWLTAKVGTAMVYVGNLGDGFNAAADSARHFHRAAMEDLNAIPEPKARMGTDLAALEAKDETAAKAKADAEKKAANDLAKLRADNDAKEEAARQKTLTLRQRELELTAQIAKIEETKRRFSLTPERKEELRGQLLDAEKELAENQAEQNKEAERAHSEEHKRTQQKIKDAEKLATEKVKAERDAQREVLADKINAEQDKLAGLEKVNPSFSVDSLRSIGGGIEGVNYNAALGKVDMQRQAVDLQRQAVDKLTSIQRQLEKADRVTAGNGSFEL